MVMVRIDIFLICFKSFAEHFVNTVHIRIYIHVTMFTMSSVLTTWWKNQLIRLTNQREGRLTAWWNVWMSPIFTFSAATLAAKATRTRASISTSETEYFQRTGGYWASWSRNKLWCLRAPLMCNVIDSHLISYQVLSDDVKDGDTDTVAQWPSTVL